MQMKTVQVSKTVYVGARDTQLYFEMPVLLSQMAAGKVISPLPVSLSQSDTPAEHLISAVPSFSIIKPIKTGPVERALTPKQNHCQTVFLYLPIQPTAV